MHPINEWEGSSNNFFWIVASEHSAISVIETTRLFITFIALRSEATIQNNLLLKPSHSFIGCIRYLGVYPTQYF